MNMKTHAIVVATIIIALLIVWQVFMTSPPVQPTQEVISAYKIDVSRASYGLECSKYAQVDDGLSKGRGPYSESSAVGKTGEENNALEAISKTCEGKPICSFKVEPKSLGLESYMSCGMEDLRIEFRCFQLDRLRKVTYQNGVKGAIDCTKIVKG